jgi:glycosyltransferase involved in cell wall biosynthesis
VADVRSWMQAADVFVLPSSTEGLSNSLLEAMAMGLPSVATEVGGASDLIEHGLSGWLIPPEDCAALEQGIIHLLSAAELRQKMGMEARKIVVQEYALDRVAEQLAALYARLTASGVPVNAAY